MVTLTPYGLRLAILEGQHAEECRIQASLQPLLEAKAREAILLARRIEASAQRRMEIEAEMTAILNERLAA
jgi:hypothetical protein